MPWRIALASNDALAADVVTATMMGFDPGEVGYLHYCKRMGLGAGDLDQIPMMGNTTMADCARLFRPHDTVHRQRRWHLPRAEQYLHPQESIT